MPGPVPKRSSERRRRNKESAVDTVRVEVGAVVEIPKPHSTWHPIAKRWYLSLAGSGQATFYEPSDWAMAEFGAEMMSRLLKQGARPSAQMLQSILSMMTDLLTSEASRRRVRLEIERGDAPAESAGVTALADYRKRAGLGG